MTLPPGRRTSIVRAAGATGAIGGGLCLAVGRLLNGLGDQPAGTTAGKTLVFAAGFGVVALANTVLLHILEQT